MAFIGTFAFVAFVGGTFAFMAFVVFAMEMAITDVEAIAGNRLEPQ